MEEIIIDKHVFRQVPFNHTYYIDEFGNVYSSYCHKIIHHSTRYCNGKPYEYVDMYFDGKQHHVPIHRLVYRCWVGEIKHGEQVNHRDDNSLNNHYSNLYTGSQAENIRDCFDNGHRVGNVFYLTVFDKKIGKTITFVPAVKFISYSNHSCKNGCIKRMFSKNWFKKRYDIIEYKHVDNLAHYKSVEAMGDECNPLG